MGSLQSLFTRPVIQSVPARDRRLDAASRSQETSRGWRTAQNLEPEGDCTLAQLDAGAKATIAKVFATGSMGAHLLEMGLTPGTPVFLRHRGSFRRVEISVRAYVFSLPVEAASLIRVTTQT